MAHIPSDPFMLLSFINMKLRDEFDSLDALCDALDADADGITEKLAGIDYHYDASVNQFK